VVVDELTASDLDHVTRAMGREADRGSGAPQRLLRIQPATRWLTAIGGPPSAQV
jgi:hypothetical protein